MASCWLNHINHVPTAIAKIFLKHSRAFVANQPIPQTFFKLHFAATLYLYCMMINKRAISNTMIFAHWIIAKWFHRQSPPQVAVRMLFMLFPVIDIAPCKLF